VETNEKLRNKLYHSYHVKLLGRLRLKCDGTRAETRFRLSVKRTSPFKSAGYVSSLDYWQLSCAHQPAGFVLLVQACVLQSYEAYWLPTLVSCFPFTCPPVRHRVPSHFSWTLQHHNFRHVRNANTWTHFTLSF
jgi:hypothetical protein